MKLYLRFLSVCYFVGATLHALDLLNLRLSFNKLPLGWKAWIVFLFLADSAAVPGLWLGKRWGVGLFLFIALSQLVAYIGFKGYFGEEDFLIIFHLITLLIFSVLLWINKPVRSGMSV